MYIIYTLINSTATLCPQQYEYEETPCVYFQLLLSGSSVITGITGKLSSHCFQLLPLLLSFLLSFAASSCSPWPRHSLPPLLPFHCCRASLPAPLLAAAVDDCQGQVLLLLNLHVLQVLRVKQLSRLDVRQVRDVFEVWLRGAEGEAGYTRAGSCCSFWGCLEGWRSAGEEGTKCCEGGNE